MARVRAVDISVDAADFAGLLGRTSQLEPALKKALRKRVREAGMEAANASKSEVLKPGRDRGRRPKERGLRRGIAKGIKVQIAASAGGKRVGVVIKSTGAGMTAENKQMVRKWNRPGGFRHPLFGDREHWYPQRGRPYWGTVLSGQRDVLAQKVRQALDDAMRDLPQG